MAVNNFGPQTSLVAAADLRTKRFYFVKQTTDTAVNLSSANGDITLGVLQNKPNINELADVLRLEGGPTLKVVAGGTINRNDPITTDANGKAVVATSGQRAYGRAMHGAVSGDLLEFRGEQELLA